MSYCQNFADLQRTVNRLMASLEKDTATMQNANDVITRQGSMLNVLEKRITEALEYCEDREDIIDGEFGPLPNEWMQLATILKGRVA